MSKQFLDKKGLAEVAEFVNKKLKTVTIMPATPAADDVVLYKGASTAQYKKGTIYLYTVVETYYAWSDLSDEYYTKTPTPEVGDTVYSDTSGTDSGYTVEAFDSINNHITVDNLLYDRDQTKDTEVYDWVAKSNTSVILNGEDKTGKEASFYAPIGAGTVGQVPVSNGEDADPIWASFTGYAPTVVGRDLCFLYGLMPEVENTSIIFNLE